MIHPWIALVLLLVGLICDCGLRWIVWYHTPQDDFVVVNHPQWGTCLESGISPRQARALEEK